MKWNEIIQQGIKRQTEHRTSPDGRCGPWFIGQHRLRSIWEYFYAFQIDECDDVPRAIVSAKDWIVGHDCQQEQSGTGSGVIIFASILVMINWDRWDEPHDVFLQQGQLRFCDKDLPLEANQKVLDLGTFGMPFDNTQHMFLPPYLHANQMIRLSENDRLPFLEEYTPDHPQYPGEKLKVQKVKVAEGYFIRKDGSGRRASYYARKQCEDTEAKFMKQLREDLKHHSGLAKFQCGLDFSPHHFSILIDWADGNDLDYRLHSSVPIVNPAYRISCPQPLPEPALQKHIITEMASVIDALAHLHEEKLGNLYLYHMDLKPGNILVYHDDYRNHVVGRWKIADFGLSVVHKISVAGQGASETPAKRPKGEFQPPEVDEDWAYRPQGVSSRGDMWSIGAIMCLVLAYALNYNTAVDDFDRKRRATTTGKATKDNFFYSITGRSAPIMKPQVREWLDGVDQDEEAPWVTEMVKLIKKCLHVNAMMRPSAYKLYKDIHEFVIAKMNGECSVDPTRPHPHPPPREPTQPGPDPTNPEDGSTSGQSHSSPSVESQERASGENSQVMNQVPYPPEVQFVHSPPVPFLSSLKTKYTVAFCPISGFLLVLQPTRTTMLRPGSQYVPFLDSEDSIEGAYSSALVRWPYVVVLARYSTNAKFRCYDHEARSLSPNLEPTYDGIGFSENTIAVSSDGEVVVMDTYTSLQLHDPTQPRRLSFKMTSGDNEAFRKVYFSLNNDALLACGSKSFFVWEKTASTWGQSWEINKDNPVQGKCPRALSKWYLNNHVLVYFRQRKAFLLHNGGGFFGIFIREDGVIISDGIRCAGILCGAITPNDCHVYYIRRKGWRPKRHLFLYRRAIVDTQIREEEEEVAKLDSLRCDDKTTAEIMILETEHADKLYIFASDNPPLSFSLTPQPQSPVQSRDGVRS